MLAMTMTDHTNSMDAMAVVSHKTDSNNSRHSWMVLLSTAVAAAIVSICWHLNCRHCHIDSNRYVIAAGSSHRSNYHPACDSWHNEHLDPSSESMAAPRIRAVRISDDGDCSAMEVAVRDAWDVFAPNRCCIHALGDEILAIFFL